MNAQLEAILSRRMANQNAAQQAPCYSEVEPSQATHLTVTCATSVPATPAYTGEDQGRDEDAPRVPTQPAVAAPLARSTDPLTSHDAAARAAKVSAKHEAWIFDAIHQAGAYGATANEIAPRIGLTKEQVNRRLSGMGERLLIHRVLKENALTDTDFIERNRCAIWFKS
jgi:hypothetical protein